MVNAKPTDASLLFLLPETKGGNHLPLARKEKQTKILKYKDGHPGPGRHLEH